MYQVREKIFKCNCLNLKGITAILFFQNKVCFCPFFERLTDIYSIHVCIRHISNSVVINSKLTLKCNNLCSNRKILIYRLHHSLKHVLMLIS